MSRTPKISVVTPVYNAESFLPEAIESVLNQSLTDFEFILIDDGSTDRTAEILSGYSSRDPRVRVHRQPRNMGVREALNTGCRLARADFIARMDADDISEPERLDRQFAFLNDHGKVGVVGSAVQLIDSKGAKKRIKAFPEEPALIAWSMLFFNAIAHPTVMMRRELVERAGLYPPVAARGPEDYALFMRLTRLTRFANLPEALLRYRVSDQNLSLTASRSLEDDAQRILRESLAEWWRIGLTAEMAGLLRGLSTDRFPTEGAQVRAMSNLLQELIAAFCADGHFRPSELAPVRRDAAVRLWLLAALAATRVPEALIPLAIRATWLSPSSGWFFLKKSLSRLTRR